MDRPSLRLLPISVLALAFAAVVGFLGLVREPVFYSGDGGMKLLAARQFARGEWTTELRLPSEPWVESLWRRGYYPLKPPFVYEDGGRRLYGMPLVFPLVSAPFYRVLGYWGLYVLPVLAWLLLACRAHRLARRLGLDPWAAALAHAGWALASFTSPYAAMFWEHLPAAALVFLAVAEVLEAHRSGTATWRAAAGGLALGLAIWLRPEAWIAAGVIVGAWAPFALRGPARRPWVALAATTGAVALGLVAMNLWLHGAPLGLHAVQVLEPGGTGVPAAPPYPRAAGALGLRLVRFAPVTFAAVALVVSGWRTGSAAVRLLALVLGGCAGFLLGVAAIVPNLGGLQWGPRYLLLAVPVLAWAVGLAWHEASPRLGSRARRALGAAVVALLAYGTFVNVWLAAGDLRQNYGRRVLPAVETLRGLGVDAVAVIDPFATQELAALAGAGTFYFLVPFDPERPERPLAAFADALRASGRTRFAFLTTSPPGAEVEYPPAFEVQGEHVRATARLIGRRGRYYILFDVVTAPRGGG